MNTLFETQDIYLRTDNAGPIRITALCAGGLAIHAALGEYSDGTYTVTHIASGKGLFSFLHMAEAKRAVETALASGMINWTLDEAHLMRISKKNATRPWPRCGKRFVQCERRPMKPTPRPWRVDRTYPDWPMIVGADGTKVNVDFENAADAELIVAAVNSCGLPDEQFEVTEEQDDASYVEWWGVPVRMP